MSIQGKTLREMVLSVLQDNNEQPLKPSEIAALINDRYPEYCSAKAASSSQANFNLLSQVAAEISTNSKDWLQKYPQLKSSIETPRTYWWENQDSEDSTDVSTPLDTTTSNSEGVSDEQSLYPKLSAYLWGMKARKIYPKRINEKTSSNTNGSNGNKALHPDVVALEDLMPLVPYGAWSAEMKEWATRSGAQQAKLWSFEVKIKINSISEARESYFQTLANSAWANYGYLVATHISDKALGELKTLSDLHGIGVILLDVANPADESIIKFPARERSEIDWGTCNRIASQNPDFRKFVELVCDFHVTRKTAEYEWDSKPSAQLDNTI